MPVENFCALVCVVTMRRFATALSACLWACGDNADTPPDAPPDAPRFASAPHTPMPLVFPHAGEVLANVQLATVTFDDYAARPQVEAFGDALVVSPWYQSVGLEYGVLPGVHAQQLTLGPTPEALSRDGIRARVLELLDGPVAPRPATGNQQLYVIYVPPSVIRGDGLQDIRGYHEMVTLDGAWVAIAVVLDDGSGLAQTTATAAHQVIDAVTNPYDPPRDGYYADPPMTDPWSLVRREVADLCEGEAPIAEPASGYAFPRIYSNHAAAAGRSPCRPEDDDDDTWSDVTASPSRMQVVPGGGSITFELTGWSTRELPDWQLCTHVADFSMLSNDEMSPTLSRDTINNNTTVTLTLHVPTSAASGATGGVYVLSGANQHPWAVGFVVR